MSAGTLLVGAFEVNWPQPHPPTPNSGLHPPTPAIAGCEATPATRTMIAAAATFFPVISPPPVCLPVV
jgi:hypothetical protein